MKNIIILLLTVFSAEALAVETGKTYRIASKRFPTLSLFVTDSRREEGTDIALWTETDVPSQQWKVVSGANGTLILQNVYTALYATPKSRAKGGTIVTSKTRADGRIVIDTIDKTAGTCRIWNTAKTLCLSAKAGDDGALPVLDTPAEGDDGQTWVFEEVEAKTEFTPAMRDEMMGAYLSQHLHSRGGSYRTFCDGGWGEAEQLEVLLDAYETTADERYLNYARQVYSYFNNKVGSDWTHGGSGGYNWFGYDFNDDVMWMVIAVARMGWLTGNKAYTSAARKNFDRIYERAYIPFTGLLRWAEQTGNRYGTNSCINGPAEVAACYLAMSGAGETYFEKARDLYASQRKYLTQNMATGKVWDNVVWNPETERVQSQSEWASTYNQGTMLGAACLLYKHYGDAQYLSDARKIMSFTKSQLCDDYGIVRVCQDPENGDLCGFKGILMRYVRLLITELDQTTYRQWMLRNALHAYCNRTAKGLTGTAWLTKNTDAVTKNPFGCSTAASVAVNTPFEAQQEDGIGTLPHSTASAADGIYSVCGKRLPAPPSHGTFVVQKNGKARKMIKP